MKYFLIRSILCAISFILIKLILGPICFAQIGNFSEGVKYPQFNLEFVNRLFNKQYFANPISSQVGYLSSDYGDVRNIPWSSTCGTCSNDIHKGVDYASLRTHHQMFSPTTGRVTLSNPNTGTIIIYNQTYDFSFFVLHCETVAVTQGQNVEIGTYLGTTGMKGNATGIHAHCELRKGNRTSAACPCGGLVGSNTYDPRIIVSLIKNCPTPEITAPVSPNTQFNHNQSINIRWNAIPNSEAYRLQISESSAFTSFVLDQGSITSNSISFLTAQPNKLYYFRVRASIPGVCTTPFSNTGNFTTNPLPPSLSFPASGASGLRPPINFSWSSIPLSNNFRIQVSDDLNFTNEPYLLNEPTNGSNQYLWNATNLESNKTYYWRVRVSTSNGVSAYTTPRSFTTASFCTAPSQPGTITGPVTICQGQSSSYSVPTVSGATSYRWTLPSGWTGTSTTNTISVRAATGGGNISVVAINGCGEGPARTLAVSIGGTLPAQPNSITGPASLCQAQQGTYSIPAVSGATSYRWTLPSGWTGTSTTNTISAIAATGGGNISVVAINACGESPARTLAVSIGGTLPAQPNSITGPASLCQAQQGTYSIPAVNGATSYRWTLPSGWTGSSTTNSISTTAGTTGGTISVVAVNNCGESVARSIGVSINPLPSLPQPISGPLIVCQGSTNEYSIPSVSGATSYSWSLPSGWTGTSATNTISVRAGMVGGTIWVRAENNCGQGPGQRIDVVSNPLPLTPASINGPINVCAGQSTTYIATEVITATSYSWVLPAGWTGSSTTNTITVTAGVSGGNIEVRALNACGQSAPHSLAITSGALPVQPSTISGATMVCQGQSQTYNVTAVSGATSYNWVLPSGWTGTSTTNTITVTPGATGGNISVRAINDCGQSVARSINITSNPLPAQPGTITGATTVCQGQSQTYSVTAVSGATSYSWVLPSGWTGSSNTNTITVTSGSLGGSLSVRAINGCGQGPDRTINLRVVNLVTFSGSGNWSNPANWTDGFIPPNPLPAGNSIIINGSGECILNVPQTISRGANIRVEPGKRFQVNGNLIIN